MSVRMASGFGSGGGILLVGLWGLFACSTPATDHSVASFYVQKLRVRRPTVPQAEPRADAGDPDYERTPRPDSHADCERPEALWKSLNLQAAWTCIVNTQLAVQNAKPDSKVPREIEYELSSQNPPELVLPPDAPIDCFKGALSRIPVPREIVFQARALGNSCFAARLESDADRVFEIPFLKKRTWLKIRFPLDAPPKSEDELRRLLLSWALTPLRDPDNPGAFKSRVVPDSACKKCLDPESLHDPDRDSPPDLWP